MRSKKIQCNMFLLWTTIGCLVVSLLFGLMTLVILDTYGTILLASGVFLGVGFAFVGSLSLEDQSNMESEKGQCNAVQLLQDVLVYNHILSCFMNENIRSDFLNGTNGAVPLSDQQLSHLDELFRLVGVKPPNAKVVTHIHYRTLAENINSLIQGKYEQIGGTTYKTMKQLLIKIRDSDYFLKSSQPVQETANEDVSASENGSGCLTGPILISHGESDDISRYVDLVDFSSGNEHDEDSESENSAHNDANNDSHAEAFSCQSEENCKEDKSTGKVIDYEIKYKKMKKDISELALNNMTASEANANVEEQNMERDGVKDIEDCIWRQNLESARQTKKTAFLNVKTCEKNKEHAWRLSETIKLYYKQSKKHCRNAEPMSGASQAQHAAVSQHDFVLTKHIEASERQYKIAKQNLKVAKKNDKFVSNYIKLAKAILEKRALNIDS